MPENNELETQIAELKALVIAQVNKPNNTETIVATTNKYTKWIQGIVSLLVVIIGLGINWGITKTKVEVLEAQAISNKIVLSSRIGKTEQDVHELQLKQAADDQLLQNIQRDIAEIKADVKELVKKDR